MQTAINAFLANPSAETQQTAQKAWRAAREFYGTTEAFRFYGGPIDDDNGPEGRINAWPMDESFVDKVEGNAEAGLINDRSFAISKEAIAGQNERGGEENIATGYHAIEFLLWGQDLRTTGPGNRAFTDFVDGKAPNADRRLSLRHLAWNGARLGIALQAEHDAAEAKAAAPVLAVFDGEHLKPVAAPQALAGYGGDIVATRAPAGDGFAVSCPRAQGIAIFTADGTWQGLIPFAEACALAAAADQVWVGGRL